jgi:hypothetical protein
VLAQGAGKWANAGKIFCTLKCVRRCRCANALCVHVERCKRLEEIAVSVDGSEAVRDGDVRLATLQIFDNVFRDRNSASDEVASREPRCKPQPLVLGLTQGSALLHSFQSLSVALAGTVEKSRRLECGRAWRSKGGGLCELFKARLAISEQFGWEGPRYDGGLVRRGCGGFLRRGTKNKLLGCAEPSAHTNRV